ncbi:hypothetical protein LMG33810_001934 [Carnimonas sp. LMG 33810]
MKNHASPTAKSLMPSSAWKIVWLCLIYVASLGISTANFYNWRSKYGGMDVSMMSRMK